MSQQRQHAEERLREAHQQLLRIRREHPDWPLCRVCRCPINPAALDGGHDTHPNCGRKDAA